MKWNEIKKGQTIKVRGEKVTVKNVRRTPDGEVRLTLEGKAGKSHYQEIYDPNDEVK